MSLFINGAQVATKDVGKINNVSSGYGGLEVGKDLGAPVSTSYKIFIRIYRPVRRSPFRI